MAPDGPRVSSAGSVVPLLETVLLNPPAGVQRILSRLHPDPDRATPAARLRLRSVAAARSLRTGTGRRRHAWLTVPRLPVPSRRRPALNAERALPVAVAALLVVASFLAAQPAPAGAVGGTTGRGADARIAIGGGGVLSVADLAAIDAAMERGDFVPVTLPEDAEGYAPAPEAHERDPLLDDGTLVAGVAPATTVADGSGLLQTYRVESGDTLVGIARKHGVSMMTVWWANKLTSKDDLHVGQILTIPPVSGLVVEVAESDTLETLAATYGVEPGRVIEANELEDPTLIVGQTLIIPGALGAGIATPKPTPRPVTRVPSGGSTTVRPPTTYVGGVFRWPVIGGGNYISQYFHYGHYGLDIAADYGSRVVAAGRGTVIFAGWKSNGGGYQVWIAHGGGRYTTYNHMSGVSVGRGQSVAKGQQVGRVGCTGHCTGPHLHFEVWVGPVWDGGYRVNPLKYL